ncbi:MAG: hypothetical protein ACD_4C00243G0005 [uncultured bacterium (gcode 4)]|uniref:Uncharacterized protein n=1 Tax=uncultured bacterium (gcode 4) TaxID=1234023 RepID=K2F656_9BACT|nr:MAG: hypothetical protein ACD_4C00243G0005 [uncultured bacterium (gcode 4)]
MSYLTIEQCKAIWIEFHEMPNHEWYWLVLKYNWSEVIVRFTQKEYDRIINMKMKIKWKVEIHWFNDTFDLKNISFLN